MLVRYESSHVIQLVCGLKVVVSLKNRSQEKLFNNTFRICNIIIGDIVWKCNDYLLTKCWHTEIICLRTFIPNWTFFYISKHQFFKNYRIFINESLTFWKEEFRKLYRVKFLSRIKLMANHFNCSKFYLKKNLLLTVQRLLFQSCSFYWKIIK